MLFQLCYGLSLHQQSVCLVSEDPQGKHSYSMKGRKHWSTLAIIKRTKSSPSNRNVNKLVDLSTSCNILIVFHLSLRDFQDCKSSHNLSGWKKRVLKGCNFSLISRVESRIQGRMQAVMGQMSSHKKQSKGFIACSVCYFLWNNFQGNMRRISNKAVKY